jgi:adenosylcobinamide amidohydrolase
MMTGADLNNAVVTTASYRDMRVTAIVTGGVESNAIRTSKDTGQWYEAGTINILVMTNHRLSEQAATRAIVTVTEAKTAALLDMDIRSAQSRAMYPATGTGTDTVIVVVGEGVTLNWSGGHSKMGELIADAVYRGVQEAILKQNGKASRRGVLERLEERGISLYGILPGRQKELEELLLSSEYRSVQSFLEAAFSLSDAQVAGQFSAGVFFEEMALAVASKIAGAPVTKIEDTVTRSDLPPVLATALDALGTGLKYRGGGGVR